MKKSARLHTCLEKRDYLAALRGTPGAAWHVVARVDRTAGLPTTDAPRREPIVRPTSNGLYIATPDRPSHLPATRRMHVGRLMITHCLVTRPSW